MIVSSGKVTELTCLWQDKNYLPKWERTAEKKKTERGEKDKFKQNSKVYTSMVLEITLKNLGNTHWSVFLKYNYNCYQSIKHRNSYHNVYHIYIKYYFKNQKVFPANIPCSEIQTEFSYEIR